MNTTASPSRVMVYVDGFNFYHATLGTNAYPFGWCNWRETARKYCRTSQIVTGVRYFTSYINATAARKNRQELHIRAMETIANVVRGEFAQRHSTCPNCGQTYSELREKKTDVNMAVQIVVDAALDLYDEAFVVTADLDLLPAIQTIVDPRLFAALHPGKNVRSRSATVLFPPHSSHSREFNEIEMRCERIRRIELTPVNIVRFPEDLAGRLGYEFPSHWRVGYTGPPPVIVGARSRGCR